MAVGLRLGLDLCGPHVCHCGELVDPKGHHGFVCRKAVGRALRHHAINDVIWKALIRADTPSIKEPSGLSRSDGKRPDGATLVPWSGGKYLTWDATVVHSCAASYTTHTARLGGPASAQAADRKAIKYQGLPSSHLFVPIAIETLGPMNSSAVDLLGEIARRMASISGESREPLFLFQRLSICLQRYNLLAFRGTFPVNHIDEEA